MSIYNKKNLKNALESALFFHKISYFIDNVTIPYSLENEINIVSNILVTPLLKKKSLKSKKNIPKIFYGLLMYFFVLSNTSKNKNETQFKNFLKQTKEAFGKKRKKSKKGGSRNIVRRRSSNLNIVNSSKSTLQSPPSFS